MRLALGPKGSDRVKVCVVHAEREGVWRFLSGSPWGYGEPMHWHRIDIKPKAQQELFQ